MPTQKGIALISECRSSHHHAFITSGLAYCNALYTGLYMKLELAQKVATSLISGILYRRHDTYVLQLTFSMSFQRFWKDFTCTTLNSLGLAHLKLPLSL